MANFSSLKTAIQNTIRTNGNNEITGQLLQDILLSMVVALGDDAINDIASDLNSITPIINNITNGYVYAGIATPSTTPVSGKVFYVAVQAGTYTNFGNTAVKPGISILKYNGSAWSNEQVIYTDGGVFDVSAYNGGATYASLEALLSDAYLSNIIPSAVRKGGMSIKFVQSSDNKYIQARLLSDEFTTNAGAWQTDDYAEITSITESEFEDGGYYDLNVGSSPRLYESATYKNLKIKVFAGDKFTISTNNINAKCALANTSDVVTNVYLNADTTSITVENDGYFYMNIKAVEFARISGNLLSGMLDIQEKIQRDSVPTANSNKLITSGAVDNIHSVRILTYTTDAPTTRCLVPNASRKKGMILIYHNGTEFIVEQFINNNEEDLINIVWGNSANWQTLAREKDIKAIKNLLGTELVDITPSITWNDGYIDAGGQVQSSTGNKYSSPIAVNSGNVVCLQAPDTTLPANRIPVCKVTGSGTEQDPYVYTPIFHFDSAYGSYIYVADESMNITIAYNYSLSKAVKVYMYNSLFAQYFANRLKENKSDITALKEKSEFTDIHIQGNDGEQVTTEEAGSFVVRADGKGITESSAYRTTKPVYFDAGTLLKINAFIGSSGALVSMTDEFGKGSFYIPKNQHDATKEYDSYFVVESGYYVFSYRYADGLSVTKYTKSTISENAANIEEGVKTLVKSVSHQGTPISGNNKMSRLYHSIIQGFNYNLVNLAFTSENIPVLNHDGYYYTNDSPDTAQQVIISEHTYAEIETMPIRNSDREILGKFDDFVKMCKLMGTKAVVMGFSYYFTSAQRKAAFDVVSKYQMKDNVIWGVGDNNTTRLSDVIDSILAWNEKASIMVIPRKTVEDESVDITDPTELLDYVENTLSNYLNEKNKIIIWVNGAAWSVSDIATVTQSIPNDVELGMYFIGDSTDAFLNYLPYITYYTHDYYTIEDKQSSIVAMAKECVKFAES